jgi:signal transduction histidine kinase
VRLLELRRTSGFRVACLFFVTFGGASLALFGLLFLHTRSYGRTAAYEWVRWESSHLVHLPLSALKERVEASRDFAEAGRPLTLFGPDGTRKAGAEVVFPKAAPIGQPFRLAEHHGPDTAVFFSQLTRLPDGNLLLVSRSAKELQSLQKALVETFAFGIAGTIAIGLIGAGVFGIGSLRQNEAITSAVERIMRGDLLERLPTRGVSADLTHLTRVVNEMLDQLEHLMLEIKGVNENIAHDLRTPLTRVMASLERSLRQARTADDFRAFNEEVLGDVKQIVIRFSALLRISEMEDRLRRAGFAQVDLDQIAVDAVEYYEPVAMEKGVVLVCETAETGAHVDGDRSLVFEALSNLIDNALKFTPPGGEVRVSVTRDPPGLLVRDTGCGIPAAELGAMRERYRRGSTTGGQAGYGIGLSLVDSIARLHSMTFELSCTGSGCAARLWRA